MKITVIADDFTGACETGCEFWKRGYSVTLFPSDRFDSDCAVFSTDSRCTFNDKKKKILSGYLKNAGDSIIYKKIDSTLRGNIIEELTYAINAVHPDFVFFLPAYPALGKCVRNGIYTVNGELIEKTVYAAEFQSDFQSSVHNFLRSVPSIHLPVIIDLIQAKKQIISCEKPCVLSFDAYTTSHCENIFSLYKDISRDYKVMICASAVFADCFGTPEKNIDRSPGAGKILVVSGSFNSVTHEQLAWYEKSNKTDAAVIIRTDEKNHKISNLHPEFFDTELRVIKTSLPYVKGKENELEHLIAEQISSIFENCFFDGLIITGGQTACSVLDALHLNSVKIAGQIEPGVIALNGSYRGRKITVIVKPGGYGSLEIFEKCRKWLCS